MSSTQLPTAAGQTIPTPPNAGQRAGNPTMVSGQLPPPPAAGKTGASTDPKKPEFAEPSKSPLRFLPYIVGGLLLLGILGFVAFRMFGGGGNYYSTGNSNTTTMELMVRQANLRQYSNYTFSRLEYGDFGNQLKLCKP
jgi:hypothetical protein